MPWSEIEAALAPTFDRKDRKGQSVEGADLFGPTLTVSGAGVSAAGHGAVEMLTGEAQQMARACGVTASRT